MWSIKAKIFLAMIFVGVFGGPSLVALEMPKTNSNCRQCHSVYERLRIQNLKLPMKKEHQDLKYNHVASPKSCLLCHDENQTNHLVLLNGASVEFKDSVKLCGQCHGLVAMDWKQGLHGKQSGKGSPDNRKMSCTECHNPHEPKFKKMKADAPPHRPHFGIDKAAFEKSEAPKEMGGVQKPHDDKESKD